MALTYSHCPGSGRSCVDPYCRNNGCKEVYHRDYVCAETEARELRAILGELLKRHDDDPENPGAAFEADPGCIECTSGVVPNDRNTGLCPHHRARKIWRIQAA